MIQYTKSTPKRFWKTVKKHPKKTMVFTVLLTTIIGTLLVHQWQDSHNYAISVNNRHISLAKYNEELEQREHFFKQANQDIDTPTLKRDVSSALVANELIAAYAEDDEITVTAEETDARYQQVIQQQYQDEEQLLAELSRLYGSNKSTYTQVLYNDLLREKVAEHLDQPIDQWLADQKTSADIITIFD